MIPATTPRPLVLGLAGALALAAAGAAFALGDATADLAAGGGKAVGDISKNAGETDRVGVELLAGARLDIRMKSTFEAALELRDPHGQVVELGAAPGTNIVAAVQPLTESGRYEFFVRSSDGSQGDYNLSAKAGWEKRLDVSGDGDTTFDVWMPAGGKLKGSFRSTGGDVTITEVRDPEGAQLVGPIAGKKGRVKLKTLTAATAGTYQVTISCPDTYSGTFQRIAPRGVGKVKLANGLTEIGYDADGVGDLFRDKCASCHAWAAAYPGVRGYASLAYSRMRTGNMPKGGGRIVGKQLALVDQWIRTGRNR